MDSLVVWYVVCDDLNFLSYVLSFCLCSTLWETCWPLCEGLIFFFSKHLPHYCSTIYWFIFHPEISVVDLYLLCWSLAPEALQSGAFCLLTRGSELTLPKMWPPGSQGIPTGTPGDAMVRMEGDPGSRSPQMGTLRVPVPVCHRGRGLWKDRHAWIPTRMISS